MIDQLLQSLIRDGVIAFLFALLLYWLTTRHEKLLEALSRSVMVTNLLLVGLQKELLIHDLTVSGLNPSAGANQDERSEKAISKYREMISIFTQIESSIRAQTELHKPHK